MDNHNLSEILNSADIFGPSTGTGMFAEYMDLKEDPLFPSYTDSIDMTGDFFQTGGRGGGDIPSFSAHSPTMRVKSEKGGGIAASPTAGFPSLSFSASSPTMAGLQGSMGSIFSKSRLSKELGSAFGGGGGMDISLSDFHKHVAGTAVSMDLDLDSSLSNSIAKLSLSNDELTGMGSGLLGGRDDGPTWIDEAELPAARTKSGGTIVSGSGSPTERNRNRNHLRPSNLSNLVISSDGAPPLPMSISPTRR